MPFQTFSPSVQPGMGGSGYTETPRVIDNAFGDNYRQPVFDGINYLNGQLQLVWPSISAANWNLMVAFFAAHVVTPFYYTLPDETLARKWRVSPSSGWKKGWGSPHWLMNCSVTFQLDYTPDPG